MATIYIPFYTRTGALEVMAQAVAEGVRDQGSEAILAFTGNLAENTERIRGDRHWQMVSERLVEDYPLATPDDLAASDGAVFGSPGLFGNMAAEMKAFIDRMGPVWQSGALINKPAGTFTSSSSMHGGQEVTNYTMWAPLVHLGFVVVGVPYSAMELFSTLSGGTPYGASHVMGAGNVRPPDSIELKVCRVLGERVAALAQATLHLHGCRFSSCLQEQDAPVI
jgi:NAD(P)H dehydrogenase (quinone)